MFNVVVFASGKGSNLKSIFEKVSKEKIKICAVVSDKKDSGAVQFAVENRIPIFLLSDNNEPGMYNYSKLSRQLKKIPTDLIVLAGFLKKLSDEFVDKFENRIINIHPALLPLFGGKGMYGMKVHKTVFESKAKYSGVTVHFVDKIYDHGKIIAQKVIDVSDAQSAEEIAQRVLVVEHELLPEIVEKFANGKVL